MTSDGNEERLLSDQKGNRLKNYRRRYDSPPWGVRAKFVLLVMVIGALFTLGAGTVHYFADQKREKEQLLRTFDRIEVGFLPALSLSVFEFDTNQTRMLLKGITLSNEVSYARVEEKRGAQYAFLAAEGNLEQEGEIGRVYPLEHVYENETRQVGRLTIQADMAAISQRVSDRAVRFLLSSAYLVLLISLTIVLIVHTMIIRHLNVAARFVSAIDLPTSKPPKLTLNRVAISRRYPDEIDEIVGALNDMSVRVTETYKELETTKETLRISASERGTLIRELYHRTKNNMQVIMAMRILRAIRILRRSSSSWMLRSPAA